MITGKNDCGVQLCLKGIKGKGKKLKTPKT